VSDQQDKNLEQLAQEAAALGVSPPAEDAPGPAAKPAASDPTAAPAAPKSAALPAWLALLLALAVAAGLGWSVREQQRMQSGLDARLEQLEARAGREQADLDELAGRWRKRLDAAVAQLQSDTGELGDELALVSGTVEDVRKQLEEQGVELARAGASDRESWLLAEVQYLLRLANQRLVMAGDVVAAQALLHSADNILLELDDMGLHEVRAAVAADLAALRAVPRVDIEGIYLRLAALVEQAGELVIFQLPEQEAQPAQAPADNWRARLRQGWEEALAKLSNYIIIRRRDVPMQALMDPQWEGLVRQNLRMLLEQAQVALLSGNRLLYRESLERARHWVGEFADSDEAAARAMSREINDLAALEVGVNLPDMSRSVQALDAVMQRRLQQGGTE